MIEGSSLGMAKEGKEITVLHRTAFLERYGSSQCYVVDAQRDDEHCMIQLHYLSNLHWIWRYWHVVDDIWERGTLCITNWQECSF